jgi:hypothetical protein
VVAQTSVANWRRTAGVVFMRAMLSGQARASLAAAAVGCATTDRAPYDAC